MKNGIHQQATDSLVPMYRERFGTNPGRSAAGDVLRAAPRSDQGATARLRLRRGRMSRAGAARLFLLGIAWAVLAACVTVNVYFPAAAVKDLSRKIEEEVQKEAAKVEKAPDQPAPAPGQAPPAQKPPSESGSTSTSDQAPSSNAGLFDILLGVTPAYAQAGSVASPDVTSPAIRKIIESRAARVAALNQYRSSGVIGENNQALVEIRNLEGITDLKSRAELQRLVKAENADREELFREIAVAKKVDPSQIPKIRETYAGTLRENARAGDWIQMPDGSWKQK